jgi:Concanavalin A-like lectin/glucanases superfamily
VPGTYPGITWDGYIDDFRVTKGLGRYSASFATPTAELPDASTTGLGLTKGDYYWTHTTTGGITNTEPVSGGLSQLIGKAESATTMRVMIGPVFALAQSDASQYRYVYTNPPFSMVTALLHFDGSNGSTTITDQTANNAWTVGGTATISTAASVFGGSSLIVPGSGNSCIKTTNSSAWDVGSGDWTIEFRYQYNGTPQTFPHFFQTRDGDVFSGIALAIDGNTVNLTLSSNGSSGNILSANVGSVSTSGWYKVLIQRRRDVITAFIDGILTYSQSIASTALYYVAGHVIILGGNATGVSRSCNCFIDEFRFTKGFAVMSPGVEYTYNSPFSNS